MFDPFVPMAGTGTGNRSIAPLTDDAIDTLIDHTSRITLPRSTPSSSSLAGHLVAWPKTRPRSPSATRPSTSSVNAVWTEDDPTHTGTSPGRAASSTP